VARRITLVAALLVAIAFFGWDRSTPPRSVSVGRFTVTCARQGRVAVPAPDGELISESEAIERACEAEGRTREVSAITSELGWHQMSTKGKRVRAWVVTYHGVVTCAGGVHIYPIRSSTPPPTPDCGYMEDVVAIDAHSGEFLVAGTGKYEGPAPG
jgi:hypothetical protein